MVQKLGVDLCVSVYDCIPLLLCLKSDMVIIKHIILVIYLVTLLSVLYAFKLSVFICYVLLKCCRLVRWERYRGLSQLKGDRLCIM